RDRRGAPTSAPALPPVSTRALPGSTRSRASGRRSRKVTPGRPTAPPTPQSARHRPPPPCGGAEEHPRTERCRSRSPNLEKPLAAPALREQTLADGIRPVGARKGLIEEAHRRTSIA